MSKVISSHINKPPHIDAFLGGEDYIQLVEFPEKTIPVKMDITKAENIAESRHFLKRDVEYYFLAIKFISADEWETRAIYIN